MKRAGDFIVNYSLRIFPRIAFFIKKTLLQIMIFKDLPKTPAPEITHQTRTTIFLAWNTI